MMKKTIVLLLLSILVVALAACSGTVAGSAAAIPAVAAAETEAVEPAATLADTQQASATGLSPVTVEYDAEDLETGAGSSGTTAIELAGDAIRVEGGGATVDGQTVTITAGGDYRLHGTLDDGQIVVDTQDEETVHLMLDGVDITCSTSAAIYVRNAEKTVITLADGAENSVTDGTEYVFDDAGTDEPNAAIFSHDDLTLNGGGSLTVQANYNHGIASQDDLKITGGTITVNAVNDGIRGRDSIAVKDASITVNAGGDGLQANNDEDAEKGTIAIESGSLAITAGLDGIQAETRLWVSGGQIHIVTGGGSTGSSSALGGRGMEGNANQTAESIKGLKAGTGLTITGGTIQVSARDDALHSDGSITIDGGDIVLASGDDGIHAETALTINGGDLAITQSYEGLESVTITLNDGTIDLVASDDGINASSGGGGAMPGQGGGGFETGDGALYIHGGTLVVDAGGDGLDANGPIEMTAGLVIVHGPTSNGNGALDYLGSFDISGGTLVAVGSAGMAEAPSAGSGQVSLMYNFASVQAGGTMVHIETTSGQAVLTFVPAKDYQSLVVSSLDLEPGATYEIYTGGNSTGTATGGLYTRESYSGGTPVDSVTLSGVVTVAGSAVGGFRGGGRPSRSTGP